MLVSSSHACHVQIRYRSSKLALCVVAVRSLGAEEALWCRDLLLALWSLHVSTAIFRLPQHYSRHSMRASHHRRGSQYR